jgi:hypothetical protein
LSGEVDAISSLSIFLSNEEATRLEVSYTPRRDHQGISDSKILAMMAASVGVNTAA